MWGKENREAIVYVFIRLLRFWPGFRQPFSVVVLLSHRRFFLSFLVRSRVLL
jgi:hypothetical protein